MDDFNIKDLETLSGIKAHTIRIWEQRYNFLKPKRTPTNIRCYNNEELKTLLNVALLNKYGFKVSHIDQMEPGVMLEKILLLHQEAAVQERIVIDLVRIMIDLDMEEFERILSAQISQHGMEYAVAKVIFPFLEKIGILWQTGHIHAAQEHLVSNIIRQKMIVAIENVQPVKIQDKTFLLFLPEGEHHELGLLFVYYVLKSRGIRIIYLGADVPLIDVEHVVRLKKPNTAYIHLTAAAAECNFDKLLCSLKDHMGGIPTIISGRLTESCYKKIPAFIQLKKSFSEVIEYLYSI